MVNGDELRSWRFVGWIAAAALVLVVPMYVVRERALRSETPAPGAEAPAEFVGAERCATCHRKEYDDWTGSDHQMAMAVASEATVRGDFDDAVFEGDGISARFYRRDRRYYVYTQGPDGEMGEFEIRYTFGYEPLQQYLVPFPGGRLQCLTIAWDAERGKWFSLYPDRKISPDDWLHWTRGGQNWNGMCAECHSTNLRKGFDPATKTFRTTWSEINVSCEACHGPGSRHVAWAEVPPMARSEAENCDLVMRTGDLSSRDLVDLCAPCHSRRTELGDYDHTSPQLLDFQVPSLLEEGLYYADGQILEEVYVYGSFVQSKMYHNDVRCSDCHDVHTLKLKAEGNDLCLQCHEGDVYDRYEHHFHQKVYEGKPSDGALCVKCHMPESTYMVVDERADHSIRVPRPDLTLEIGVPNACGQSGCHDDETVEWTIEHYREWYGKARKPHYGTVLAAGRRGDPGAEAGLIRLAGDELYPAIVRATALSLLGGYGGEASQAAFRRALADEDALVRYTAAEHVSAADPGGWVDLLAPLLLDPVRAVRTMAASRLAGLPRRFFKPYQWEALQKGLAEYEKAMSYSLDFPHAAHNLGNLYVRLGDPKRAEAFYRSAIEIDDLFFPAKANLAVLLSSQGKNREAEALLREILEAYPDMPDVSYSLGLLLAETGRREEALPCLQRAAEGMKDSSRAWYNLGLLQQQLGRIEDAGESLNRALEAEPRNLDFLYALADFHARRGDLRKALELAERMIAEDPDNPLGRRLRRMLEERLRER